ncbi:MAG: phospholipase, partial [Lentisphaeria bacterium]|nr:phospholipase [Lentisphaeria bacterium]
KRREVFLKEWNCTLQYLRDIGHRLAQAGNRPSWVPVETPQGVQADQFLHAYYYRQVMDGNRARHRQFHERNRSRSVQALVEAVEWWSGLPGPPSNELKTIQAVPDIVASMSVEVVLQLDVDQFTEVFSHVHAFRVYANRANHRTLGLSEKPPEMSSEERGRFLARRVYSLRNQRGESILELLHYLLHGGATHDAPHRLFDLCNDPARRLRHVGLSTLGEVVGWALPTEFPPRNGRTSKALYALGYDVTIHTE